MSDWVYCEQGHFISYPFPDSFFRSLSGQDAPKDAATALLLSDSCIKRLRQICDDGTFLRITVEGGGCSGFQYKFDFDKTLNPDDDIVFGPADARVVVDTISMDYCAGATLDYHEELIRAGFRMLANPKAEQSCSCGSSFAIKLD